MFEGTVSLFTTVLPIASSAGISWLIHLFFWPAKQILPDNLMAMPANEVLPIEIIDRSNISMVLPHDQWRLPASESLKHFLQCKIPTVITETLIV